MTTEANTNPAPSPEPTEDAYAEAGAILADAFFPSKKEEPAEPDAPTEPAPASKEGEPEKPDEPEKPKEEKPAWQIAMARKKLKQAEQYEGKVTEFAKQIQGVAESVKQQETLITGVIDGIKQDPVKAFDEICRIAGIDPVTGFERLARAKIQARATKTSDEPAPQENPELVALKKELAELKAGLSQREQQVSQNMLVESKVKDHMDTVNIIRQSDAFEYAKNLDEQELNEAVKVFVNHRYSDRDAYKMSTPARMARAVDEYAKEQYEKWAKKYGQKPAQPAPRAVAAKTPLSNRDAAESSTREMTEQEKYEAAGEEIQRLMGLIK